MNDNYALYMARTNDHHETWQWLVVRFGLEDVGGAEEAAPSGA